MNRAVVSVLVTAVLMGAATGATSTGSGTAATAVPTVTTGEPHPIDGTQVALEGNVTRVDDSVVVWFEYRQIGQTEWNRTRERRLDRPGRFFVNATGLEPTSGYEYRAVAATSDGRANGSIQRFKTPPNGSDPGTEQTTGPSPLPTTGPTPTPEELTEDTQSDTPTQLPDRDTPPPVGGSGDNLFEGWTLLLLVFGGVPIVGGGVLGGLVLAVGLYEREDED